MEHQVKPKISTTPPHQPKEIIITTNDEAPTFPPQIEEIITEDGILCTILSSLTLRNAVRTSVLSRRWRHLWTHLPNLKFDVVNMFDDHTTSWLRNLANLYPIRNYLTPEEVEIWVKIFDKFIRSVDSVVQHHQGLRVDNLTVQFPFMKVHSSHLDAYVHFAVASKTKKLVLNLRTAIDASVRYPDLTYDFPFQLFSEQNGSPSIEHLCLTSCSFKPPHKFDGLSNLKVLHLSIVDVTEDDLKRLLSNCPILETLTVKMCHKLTALSISHPKLSYLGIVDCHQLRKIDIDVINLAELTCIGVLVDILVFRRPTKVTKSSIFICHGNNNLDFTLPILSSYLPELETLFFRVDGFSEGDGLPKDSISFNRLKRLSLFLNSEMSLLCLASFLNAAPFLEELKLRDYLRNLGENPPGEPIRLMRPSKCSHTQLRTVEIASFCGAKWQIGSALYLIDNAIKLESMRIEVSLTSPEEYRDIARKYLIKEVPANVKLVIV